MATKPLKKWVSWHDGMGYPTDDGEAMGYYGGYNIVTFAYGEIRVAPIQQSSADYDTAAPKYELVSYTKAEELATGIPVLYAIDVENTVFKLQMSTPASFGNVLDSHTGTWAGAAAARGYNLVRYNDRHYKSFRMVGGEDYLQELTTIGAGAAADTWTTSTLEAAWLGRVKGQLVRVGRSGGSGLHKISLLKPGGTALTEADWGAFFAVGEASSPIMSILEIDQALFVVKPDGLWAFDDVGNSALITPDIRNLGEGSAYQHWTLSNSRVWKQAIWIPTDNGLWAWDRQNLRRVTIGPGLDAQTLVPAGVDTFTQGRFSALAVAGDYIYAVFLPDLYQSFGGGSAAGAFGIIGGGGGSTAARVYVLAGHLDQRGALSWCPIAANTVDFSARSAVVPISAIPSALGVVSTSSPLTAGFVQPTLWTNLAVGVHKYFVLHQDMGVLRQPSASGQGIMPAKDVPATTAKIFFSEIFWPDGETPASLTLVVDRLVPEAAAIASSDRFQVSYFADGGPEKNLGSPIINNGSHSLYFRDGSGPIHRLLIAIEFTGNTAIASGRESPVIRYAELLGKGN